jgi:xanthine dehydrogenase/oxidase
MNPMLAALGAKLVVSSVSSDDDSISRRCIDVTDFFVKYRTVDLKPNEIVERIEVPVLDDVFDYLRPFKQARRREDDISIVTSGMRIRIGISEDKYIIKQIALAYGGMAPMTVMAVETAKAMTGAEFNAATFEMATKVLLQELNLPENVPGGQAAYRMTLAASFLYKFFLYCVQDLKADVQGMKGEFPAIPDVDEKELASLSNFLSAKKPSSSGVQLYPAPKVAEGLEEKTLPAVKKSSKAKAAVVGKASAHMSGPLHCTGEALYTDDIPLPADTLQAALVLSSECGGILEAIDASPALALPGVVGVYTSDDIAKLGGSNELGPIVHDEVVFLPLGEKVRTVGQVLGIVVAESLESAELGANLVKVQYSKPTDKIIVTVDDAIEAGSFYEFARHGMERGDSAVIESLGSTDDFDFGRTPKVGDIVKVSGSFRSGAQEHFYLETNSTLVVPSESDTNLTIYASTQAPTKTQTYCAKATGVPASKV